MEDFAFYWGHRTLHTPFFYKRIHKIHHEFMDSISICSEYAHPIEFLMGNIFPLTLGMFILYNDIHILTFTVFALFRLAETIESHGGYEFPWAMTRFIPLNCK